MRYLALIALALGLLSVAAEAQQYWPGYGPPPPPYGYNPYYGRPRVACAILPQYGGGICRTPWNAVPGQVCSCKGGPYGRPGYVIAR
jgi:hypothetical protein